MDKLKYKLVARDFDDPYFTDDHEKAILLMILAAPCTVEVYCEKCECYHPVVTLNELGLFVASDYKEPIPNNPLTS